jgi:hypothetical protein
MEMIQTLENFVAAPPGNQDFTEETVILAKSLESDLQKLVRHNSEIV